MTEKKEKTYTPIDPKTGLWNEMLADVTENALASCPNEHQENVRPILRDFANDIIKIADTNFRDSGGKGVHLIPKLLFSPTFRKQSREADDEALESGRAALLGCAHALNELGITQEEAISLSGVTVGKTLALYDKMTERGDLYIVPHMSTSTVFPENTSTAGRPTEKKASL